MQFREANEGAMPNFFRTPYFRDTKGFVEERYYASNSIPVIPKARLLLRPWNWGLPDRKVAEDGTRRPKLIEIEVRKWHAECVCLQSETQQTNARSREKCNFMYDGAMQRRSPADCWMAAVRQTAMEDGDAQGRCVPYVPTVQASKTALHSLLHTAAANQKRLVAGERDILKSLKSAKQRP